MVQITVGQVAGIIAAVIFIARLWAPSGLILVLSGLLGDKNSATTWTISSRAFQRSLWPFILQSDSSQTRGARTRILLVTRLVTWMSILITLASIITPLGLYEALVSTDSVQVTFQYLQDKTPFGLGTPLRSTLPFSRDCSDPCPFSNTVEIIVKDSNGNVNTTYPYGYDTKIPQIIMDIYSSGYQNTTVSNFFDIQWRRYYTTSAPTYDNGSAYLISEFRNMQSLVLNDEFQLVEGLVVDMVNGGVGFRNHTFPPGFQNTVTWTEDLLFVEPETVCVNSNLTVDYTIVQSANATHSAVGNLVLTDRGGFVNLQHTYPAPNMTDPQSNLDLWTRAYAAAWWNNYYSALYYDITDDNNGTAGSTAFSHMNSALNTTFQLPEPSINAGAGASFLSLKITQDFGDFTGVWSGDTEVLNSSNPAESGTLSNPFYISSANFSLISEFYCGGAGTDYKNPALANITNVFVICGLIYGAPQRQSPGNSLIFESGSQWSQPLYTCASTLKVTIKTVSLSYNGTDASLGNLAIANIQDKVYTEGQDLPLWGVENTEFDANNFNVIWGLVSDEYANHPNVSTVRRNSLYLPGSDSMAILTTIGSEFLAGADAFMGAMGPVYDQNADQPASDTDPVDYTGTTDISMLVRWQNLSRSEELVSQIPNLIWTDVIAQSVVGTKGVLGSGNAATKNIIPISVTPTVSRIKYHWPYAVPALLAALILLLITIAAIITVLFGRNSIARLRLHLQRLAPGRIFTTFLYPEEHNGMTMPSKQWAKAAGKTLIDLSGECPTFAGASVGEGPGKPPMVSKNQQSGPTHGLEEVGEYGYEEGYEQGHGHADGLGVRQRFLGGTE